MLSITNHQQIEVTIMMRYCLTPVRRAINKTTKDKYWGGCGEKGNLSTLLWECKLA
jgi:hypothetical protein